MAARKYSVGIGPVPVPPERGGSSTTRSNPPAATVHRQPPSHRATTELVCGASVMPPPPRPASASPRPPLGALVPVGPGLVVLVPVVSRFAVVVTGRAGRQLGLPGPQVTGIDETFPAHHPLQRAQPALVVVPALTRGMGGLPRGDLADQRLTEVLPVHAPGVVERERDAERPALPRRGEDQLAVVPGRGGRARRIEQVGGVGASARAGHGAVTFATPTMASLVTRPASSSSEALPVPAGRSGSTMYRTSELES